MRIVLLIGEHSYLGLVDLTPAIAADFVALHDGNTKLLGGDRFFVAEFVDDSLQAFLDDGADSAWLDDLLAGLTGYVIVPPRHALYSARDVVLESRRACITREGVSWCFFDGDRRYDTSEIPWDAVRQAANGK